MVNKPENNENQQNFRGSDEILKDYKQVSLEKKVMQWGNSLKWSIYLLAISVLTGNLYGHRAYFADKYQEVFGKKGSTIVVAPTSKPTMSAEEEWTELLQQNPGLKGVAADVMEKMSDHERMLLENGHKKELFVNIMFNYQMNYLNQAKNPSLRDIVVRSLETDISTIRKNLDISTPQVFFLVQKLQTLHYVLSLAKNGHQLEQDRVKEKLMVARFDLQFLILNKKEQDLYLQLFGELGNIVGGIAGFKIVPESEGKSIMLSDTASMAIANQTKAIVIAETGNFVEAKQQLEEVLNVYQPIVEKEEHKTFVSFFVEKSQFLKDYFDMLLMVENFEQHKEEIEVNYMNLYQRQKTTKVLRHWDREYARILNLLMKDKIQPLIKSEPCKLCLPLFQFQEK